jgi:hypothetical protein
MGDDKYWHTIYQSAHYINKLYPESNIYLYDWGIKDQNLRMIDSTLQNMHVVDWKRNIKDINNKVGHIKNSYALKLHINKESKRIRKSIKNNIARFNFPTFLYNKLLVQSLKSLQFEYKLLEKINCMKDFSNKIGNQNGVFLDADAILVNKINELFDQDFDIAVTLRRKHEINFSHNKCQVVNSGVVIFGQNHKKRNKFLEEWEKEALNTHEYLKEQTGLTRLIQKYLAKDSFDYFKNVIFDFYDTKLKLLILPCDEYNYNWIEEVIKDKSKINSIKILHFKGSRHNHKTFKNLLKDLELA